MNATSQSKHASYHPKNGKHFVVVRCDGTDTWHYYRTAEHAYAAMDAFAQAGAA